MTIQRIRGELAGEIAGIPVFNHHEHCWSSFSAEDAVEFDLAGFLAGGYLRGDLVSAGVSFEEGSLCAGDDAGAREGTWENLRPFLDRVRSTAYFRYLLLSLDDLFGVSEGDIFCDRWRDASDRLLAYSRENKAGGPALCERMGVSATAMDAKLTAAGIAAAGKTTHRVLHVLRLDRFIHEARGLADTLEQVSPCDFDAWLAAFDGEFRAGLEAGAAGIKIGLAYNRRIEFTDAPEEQARRIFDAGVLDASPPDKTTYQDAMVNRICRLCVEADVPLQIHTGIQAGGGVLEDTRPTLLTSLFQRHPDLRVDLFHGGYPWVEHAGLMAKYFPNVYIDGCWLSHISPSAYRRALRSWIETVPMTKIFAFGGDHAILELSYGALAMAKDSVTDVLAELVDEDYFTMDVALNVARQILCDNGLSFWRVEGV